MDLYIDKSKTNPDLFKKFLNNKQFYSFETKEPNDKSNLGSDVLEKNTVNNFLTEILDMIQKGNNNWKLIPDIQKELLKIINSINNIKLSNNSISAHDIFSSDGWKNFTDHITRLFDLSNSSVAKDDYKFYYNLIKKDIRNEVHSIKNELIDIRHEVYNYNPYNHLGKLFLLLVLIVSIIFILWKLTK